jgi:hypothetical protein
MRLLAFVILTLLPFSPALAQDTAAKADAPPSTRIEADNEAGVIRFIVKGKVAAILTEGGFHVREHLQYGGVLTDGGTEGFDDLLKAARPPKDSGDAQ